MSIQTLAKKLRKAADVLDELLEIQGTPTIAKKILKKHSYKGKHWTQTPEGRKRIALASKRAWKKRAENVT